MDFLGPSVSVAHPYLNAERQACLIPKDSLALQCLSYLLVVIIFSFIGKTQPPPPQPARSASSATVNLMVSTEPLAENEIGEL